MEPNNWFMTKKTDGNVVTIIVLDDSRVESVSKQPVPEGFGLLDQEESK